MKSQNPDKTQLILHYKLQFIFSIDWLQKIHNRPNRQKLKEKKKKKQNLEKVMFGARQEPKSAKS